MATPSSIQGLREQIIANAANAFPYKLDNNDLVNPWVILMPRTNLNVVTRFRHVLEKDRVFQYEAAVVDGDDNLRFVCQNMRSHDSIEDALEDLLIVVSKKVDEMFREQFDAGRDH